MKVSRSSAAGVPGESGADDSRAGDSVDDGSIMVGGGGVGDGASDDLGDGVGDATLSELLRRARGPRDWRALSSREAAASWGELRDWVEWLRAEFGFDHRVVPPCWYRHRPLVSVLSAVHDHWLAGYDPMGSLLGPGEWHRGLMQLEARLRDWASRTGCTLGEHRADVAITYPAEDDAWQAHVVDDVTVRQHREQQRTTGRNGSGHDPHLPIPLALVSPSAAPGAAASVQGPAAEGPAVQGGDGDA